MRLIETLRQGKFFRLKFATLYFLAKLKFTHRFLPKTVSHLLPLGWNHAMFWLTFKTAGRKVYMDYYAKLRIPTSFQPKVKVDEAYQFSEAEIRFFYDNGYLGPFTLMTPEEAGDLKKHIVDLVADTTSSVYSFEEGDFELDLKEKATNGQGNVLSNQQVALMRMRSRDRYLDDLRLRQMFKHPAITERCAQLLGPNLMLWRTQFFPKKSSNCGTPTHQATTNLSDKIIESVLEQRNDEELFQVTIWIALTDVTAEKGAMVVIPGTHKDVYPITAQEYKANTNSGQEKNRFGTMAVSVEYPIQPEQVQCIEMKAGQFFIFSERLIHGSLANTTQEERWAVNGRIVSPETRIYSEKMLKEGHSYRVQNVSLLKLDKWKTLMIRGEDTYGYNRVLVEK